MERAFSSQFSVRQELVASRPVADSLWRCWCFENLATKKAGNAVPGRGNLPMENPG